MRTYIIATESRNGTIIPLNLPKMTYEQAKRGAEKLRQLQPLTTILVINTQAN